MATATITHLPNRFAFRIDSGVENDPVFRVFVYKFFATFPEMDIVGLRAVARVIANVPRPFLAPEDASMLLDHDETPRELIEQQVEAVSMHDFSGGGLCACFKEIANIPDGTTDRVRELYAVALMARLHSLADVCHLMVIEKD